MKQIFSQRRVLPLLLVACFAGCSEDDNSTATVVDAAAAADSAAIADNPAQTPPQGKAAIEAWLATGAYKAWNCEAAPHASRSPSPHGINRICSNALLSAAGAGEYPVGASSVKELFEADKLTGYAVTRHTRAGKTGDTWYWYERIGSSVVADGTGETGTPKNICVGCHAGAGSDADHSGHDQVYTQVK